MIDPGVVEVGYFLMGCDQASVGAFRVTATICDNGLPHGRYRDGKYRVGGDINKTSS